MSRSLRQRTVRANVDQLNQQTNVFIDDEWHVRLADFGLAGFADATFATHTSTHAGSIRWMAPELHEPELFHIDGLRRTKASDVYSFACVILEVLKYSILR